MNVGALLEAWNAQPADGWNDAEDYRRLGNGFLDAGEQLLAYDVLSAGLERFPDDVALTQRAALALARSGATGRANDMLRALLARDASDEQTLGLLART